MRELSPQAADELQRIVVKDLPGSNGHERTPAMSTAERSVTGGFGHLGCGNILL